MFIHLGYAAYDIPQNKLSTLIMADSYIYIYINTTRDRGSCFEQTIFGFYEKSIMQIWIHKTLLQYLWLKLFRDPKCLSSVLKRCWDLRLASLQLKQQSQLGSPQKWADLFGLRNETLSKGTASDPRIWLGQIIQCCVGDGDVMHGNNSCDMHKTKSLLGG